MIDTRKLYPYQNGVDLETKLALVETILKTDNLNLDEFQEIVNFITANKDTLDNLSINNIAGLQTALDSKVLNSRVLTDVPSGAKFTDTTYTKLSEFTNDTNYLTEHQDITGKVSRQVVVTVKVGGDGLIFS